MHVVTLLLFPLLFSLLCLHLLPDLLLHLDTIISMPAPVCCLAPLVTVVCLKQERVPYICNEARKVFVTLRHPAHLLFSRLDTSAWQNQQILSALSVALARSALATLALAALATLVTLAWAAALLCLALLPSFRIFSSLFLSSPSLHSLRMKWKTWDQRTRFTLQVCPNTDHTCPARCSGDGPALSEHPSCVCEQQ